MEVLICPVCGGGLTQTDSARSMRCGRGHCFDIARQGYVSLVTGSRAMGDTAEMVRARASFLVGGMYEPIAQTMTQEIQGYIRDVSGSERLLLADLGGGTGWYSAYILDRVPSLDGVLLDVSSQAAKVAARAHPRLRVATADLWKSIPLADSSVDIAMVVFAPRNPDEIYRILVPGGACLVVTPQPNHLGELRESMLSIEPEKEVRLAEQFSRFRAGETSSLQYRRVFSAQDVADVIAMGPSAFHKDHARAEETKPTEVTISVALHWYIRPVE